MINATPTPSSVSGQAPRDPGLAAKPAPLMATPKKKLNLTFFVGGLILFLILVGGAVGFYLTQQPGIGDTRQQAAGVGGTGTGSGACGGVYVDNSAQPPEQVRCSTTQSASSNGCVNTCSCGYSSGVCGNKAGGAGCYTGSQCQSGVCEGGVAGTNATLGTCKASGTTPVTCPGGYSLPAPSSCTGTQRLDVLANGCGACVAKPSINCYFTGNNCSITTVYGDTTPVCMEANGYYPATTVGLDSCRTASGNQCWSASVPPGGSQSDYRCTQVTVGAGTTCNGTVGGGVLLNGFSYGLYTTQAVCEAALPAFNGTGGSSNISCFDQANNCQIVTVGKAYVSETCEDISASSSNKYYTTLQACLSNKPGLSIEAGASCPSANGCTCASGPDRGKSVPTANPAGSVSCAAYRVNGAACTEGFQCRSTYCAFNGGIGQCADIPASMQACSAITTPTVCQGRSDCNWNGSSCANKTPGTGGTGLLCPNPPNLAAKKWIKFTCPNGCTQTTEGGVTAYRCYENRVDSNTPLTLNGDECGQVDVLSGDTDATYCGYSQYNCDLDRCKKPPTSSPAPSPSPVTVTCANLQPLDATTLAPVSSVTAGQQIRFRCSASAGITPNYYFFAARSSTTGPLNLIYQGDSDLTFPITVTDYLHVQCNPCVGTTCASAQSVNQSCNFEYTKTIPPGPQCLALWMASTKNPTVSLTNPKVGDRILLGCGQVQGAARYIFKVTEPDGNVVNLGPLDATVAPSTSQEYAITKKGRHYAQCQICTGQADSTCFAYETLPSQGQ